MRAMRTLGTMAVLGGAALLVYGCSAAANAPVGDSADGGGNANQDYGGGGGGTTDASTSGGKRDGGGTGGGVYDAGPPKLPEGSPCDPSTALSDPESTETCGLCGTQTRACLGDAADGGGSFKWAAWGTCTGEVTSADKCDPSATYPSTACGNCGTTPQICGSDCHFETGFDCTEPAGACTPGDIKFVLGASCTTAGQGRAYTCSSSCAYGSPSACEAPPPNPNSLTISSTAGNTVNATFTLSASKSTDRPSSGSCPTTIDTGSNSAYMDIAIINPTARNVTVSVWDGRSTSGNALDTVMAWYASPVWPVADRTACSGSVSDDCDPGADCANTASGDNRWSSLSGTGALSIPAGATVTVTVAMYDGTDAPGPFKLFAKTEN